jgi:hypothetical protein
MIAKQSVSVALPHALNSAERAGARRAKRGIPV